MNGAVATDLSRIALDFAKSDGKSWPQSHVDLKSVPNRTFGTDNKADPQAARAAKADISQASIRNEFQKKPHTQREPRRRQKHHVRQGRPEDSRRRRLRSPTTKPTTRRLGWQNKNTLSPAVSTPLPGDRGYAGIDPQHAPFNPAGPNAMDVDSNAGNQPGPSNPAPEAPPKKGKGKAKEKPPPAPVDSTTKHHKMANVLNMALSDNNSNVTRTFGTLQHGILPIANNPRPDGLFQAVHDALGNDPANKPPRTSARAPSARPRWPRPTSPPRSRTSARNTASRTATWSTRSSSPARRRRRRIPDSRRGDGTEVKVDNSEADPDIADPSPVTPDEQNDFDQQNQAEQDTDNAKAAKAEELAGRMLATELGRPLRIHHGDGTVQTLLRPVRRDPAAAANADPDAKPKRGEKKTPPASPVIGQPLDLDARPNPNGRTTYSPHTPSPTPARPATTTRATPGRRRGPRPRPSRSTHSRRRRLRRPKPRPPRRVPPRPPRQRRT